MLLEAEHTGSIAMWSVIKSVLAAFFGVQRDQQRREDFEKGSPLAFIVTGVVMGLVLVGLLALVAIVVAG
jgi:3-dehydroquinate dehydratase